jgi:FHA domain
MRPQIADIVEVVAEALQLGQEDLGNGKFLVPSYFEVDLHPEALEALKPVEKQLRKEVQKRLDKEMALLNKIPFWKRLIGKRETENPPYQNASGTWDVILTPTLDSEKPLNHIGVDAKLENPNQVQNSGLLDSLQKTQALTMNVGGGFIPATAKVQNVATLSYSDINGQFYSYPMQQNEMSIGRFDTENPHVTLRIAAPAEVSRQHCFLKQENGQYFIQDNSANGTWLNGNLLSPNQWTAFQLPAKIVLAQVIHLEIN